MGYFANGHIKSSITIIGKKANVAEYLYISMYLYVGSIAIGATRLGVFCVFLWQHILCRKRYTKCHCYV